MDILATRPALRESWERLQALRRRLEEPCHVVVCGLLKAGKSSLLNALTDQLEPERFKTGVTRTTTEVQKLEQDGLLWIDTPGLDAFASDDEEAWRGLLEADLILFVHGLGSAELEAQERAFLKELLQRDPTAKERLLVIWSQIDTIEHDQLGAREPRRQAGGGGGRAAPLLSHLRKALQQGMFGGQTAPR